MFIALAPLKLLPVVRSCLFCAVFHDITDCFIGCVYEVLLATCLPVASMCNERRAVSLILIVLCSATTFRGTNLKP